MHLADFAVRRPIATSMLLLAGVLLGAVALARLEVTLLPEMREDEILVWVPVPGAGVAEIEEGVARPVEESLVTVRGVRGLYVEVVPGGASVRVRLQRDVDPDLVALGLREKLDSVRWQLPEGVERPILLAGGLGERPSLVLALAAHDLVAASEWAESVLRARLEQIDGVARAEVVGAPKREIQIVPDPDAMALQGVGIDQLVAALRSANIEAPGGLMRRRGIRYALQVESGLHSAQDIEEVVLLRNDWGDVRIRDVARVVDGFAPEDGWSRLDGRPSVGIFVFEESGANLVEVSDRVHEQLDIVRREDGADQAVEISVVSDPSPFVRQSISGVWQAVWLGGLLAFFVLYVFLRDLRAPFVLFAVLPVSVITSFAALELFEVSLNLMSLGGLALGIGMLVDNSIICLENIHRLRGRGLSKSAAAAQGAREVSLPILASTLTTCAVFLPLAWIPGPIGVLFRDQAIAVSVSLLVSLVTALTLLPMLASRMPMPARLSTRRPGFALYHRLLWSALRHRAVAFGGVAAVAALSLWGLASLPREVIPDVDTEELQVELTLPPGTDVTVTDDAVRELEAWCAGRSEIEQTFVTVGAAGSVDPSQSQRRLNRGALRVRLRADQRQSRPEVVRELRGAFADRAEWHLEVLPPRQEMAALFRSREATLTCEITGPDPDQSERLAGRLAEQADAALAQSGHPLPSSQPLRSPRAEAQPRLALRLDDNAVSRLGLESAQVFAAVESRTTGLEATRLRRFDEEVPVVIRPAHTEHPAEGWIWAGGRSIPMRDLFQVRTELAPARLLRIDQARVSTIEWNGPLRRADRVHEALANALTESMISGSWPSGYTARFGGAAREMSETLRALVRAFLLSAGLVLLILAAQFESLRLPAVIFAAVPLALVGASAALWATGATLNAFSAIGLVVLIGIVVNDSILKVDLLRRLRAGGTSRLRAILVASRDRYRPILMTTATTSLALVPLYFGSGAELRAPLATVVIGGLLSATVLTLLVVPLLFDLVAPRPRGNSMQTGPAADTPSITQARPLAQESPS